MNSPSPADGIAWDRVRESLPGTAHELLEQIRQAYAQNPDAPARAIELVVIARIATLRDRFEQATKVEAS